ncbi:class I SAM-dependent methyltransferase [Pusillimonas sp. ANT_WB101]|uniref:class I SAM-dependent methyltransferase n=1 Tax=Pusillimonas sp. ANT_WB101 TaxID=2597356 RepID=UPI0011EF00DA|nr:class I SAM-dependent methyltransferase [Pusillimonas sp. ANT_WB101]KAA0910816.1 class I SAM-dependent methyltransferase [Pusillimonas sp. ANT_WB101]
MISSIDFAELYRRHLLHSQRAPRPASVWDARAKELSRKARHSSYAQDFISHMDLDGVSTLLDVGCGPGTICLPLAHRLQHVYGLDYSAGMLDCLMEIAADQKLTNVTALHLSWDSDWSGVPVCDIAVASRSSMVNDLALAIEKLNKHARKRVYMTHIVGGHFIDAQIASLLGRIHEPVPDYIYAVNILYAMGIHPTLSYIETPSRLAGAKDFTGFAEKVAGSVGELSPPELATLHAWYNDNPERAQSGVAPMQWALLSWKPKMTRVPA